MKRSTTPTPHAPLPQRFWPLFWEYDVETLDWVADRDLIVRRILTDGDWSAIIWLREHLGDTGLRTWLKARQGDALSPRQLRFWELILELPPASVDAWIASKRHSVWEDRTHRRPAGP